MYKNKPDNLTYLSVFLIIILLGCSNSDSAKSLNDVSTMGRWWGNFVSYFNVYYNANKQYQTALKLIYQESLKSGEEISTVFPSVKKGTIGAKELNASINKCAAILQNHPESDLVDDALILMGKSYYYLGELPPAERKFNEAISNYPNNESIFESTLFLARTFAEQNKIEQASAILNELISRDDVPSEVKGEAFLITGERYYSNQQYGAAKKYIEQGVELFNDQEAVSRGYYLLGKINAVLKNFSTALENMDDAKKHSDLTATWYWAGISKVRIYVMMRDFATAQKTLDNLSNEDELLGYRNNFTIEQARIRIAKDDFEGGEKILKQFITDNPKSPLIGQSYFELGLLRKNNYKTNFEIARYYFEQAGKGNGTDSLILVARREESLLKNYLNSFLELHDLQTKVNKGIIVPDSTLLDSVKLDSALTVNDESDNLKTDDIPKRNKSPRLAESPKRKNDKVTPKPMGAIKQGNVPNLSDEELFLNSNQQQLPITTEFTLEDSDLLMQSLATKYQSKYNIAVDSVSFAALNKSLIGTFEKIIEYFYFQTGQYDSTIAYVNQFESLFPTSERLPRLLFAKYNSLKLLGDTTAALNELNQIAHQFPKTRFGLEANQLLGIVDSISSVQKNIVEQYNVAIALLDSQAVVPSKKILTSLSSIDTTNVLYPKILFALGFIAEKYDKDWIVASNYYTRIQRSFPSSKVSIELKKQLDLTTTSIQIAKAEISPNVEAKDQTNDGATNPAVAEKIKKSLTKFVITPNLPARFKRQPKLADVSW